MYDPRVSCYSTTAFMTQNKIRNSLHHQSCYSNEGLTTRGNSPANSRQASPRLSDASRVVVLMHVKSQQTSPSIGYMPSLRKNRQSRKEYCYCRKSNRIPAVKRTHTSPNLYSSLDMNPKHLPNLCVTDNPTWSTEMISECSNNCVPTQKRSSQQNIIRQCTSLVHSFSIQTINTEDAETFV
jgi:hypothetical protein